ncbi:hypothetical protein [Lysinibacillus sphaericus]|uniref:Phosphoadenosine phosphosulphate reductase domain-containing protein n=1 Tax=Lysinibacillus sphaericus TaxID=1421 RepID=A0A6H0A076_LYSSH|nr:hypothetical protein [Lysinibacillus sphaericus]QIS31195.1 hypothetical protein [Lysinibacillus sphaericus]QPA61257.1 hypothetical protein INQ55_23260 [Lysinibacillus sphaericus]
MQLELFDKNDFKQHKKYLDGLMKSKEDIIKIAQKAGRTRLYKVLSFGGGTQSSHLLEAHFRNEIDYDFIVFSDTGAEPEFIHEQVSWWRRRQKELSNNTPFIITTHNSMERGLEEMLMRYLQTDYQRFQLPLYFNKVDEETGEIRKGGLMKRQCTGDFKIVPAQQAVRNEIKKQLGLRPKQQIPKDIGIIMDIGFSYDEMHRVGGYISHQSKYIYLAYPLIEQGLTTQDSIEFLINNDFPSRRSRCYFCPFNCSGERARDIGMDWEEIIETEPISFLKACFFDEELRKCQASGKKNMQSIPYFHFSRKALKEVYSDSFKLLNNKFGLKILEWRKEWELFIDNKYKQA